MPKLKSIAEIAEYFKHKNLTEDNVRSLAFKIVGFMLDNVTQEAVDCGAYFMPGNVGDTSLKKAFEEMLWALYDQHFDNQIPQAAGPWVNVNFATSRITVTTERHR